MQGSGLLTQAQVDVVLRAAARHRSVQDRLSKAWLAVKYRQYLHGGWTRSDGTLAKPHTKAIDFHEACKDPLHHTFVIGGGRRSSKTFSAMSEFCAWVRYSRPWDNTPTCPVGPPRRWLIVAPNYSTAVPDVIEPYLDMRLGDVIVDRVRNQQKALVTAVLKDGSIIRINTFEQYLKIGREQTSVFQSGHFDGVLCDEVPPREVWIGIKRGLVTGRGRGWGKAIIAATPDKAEFGWVYDELYSKAHNKGGGERGIFATEFSIYDNPANTDDAIESLKSGLSEEEIEAVIYGHFRHLTGRVYKTYDEKIHLARWDPLVDAQGYATTWPIVQIIDPAGRRPFYILYAAIDPEGGRHYVREWPTEDFERMRNCALGWSDYAKIIEEIEAGLPHSGPDGVERSGRDRVLWRLMDPNYGPTPSSTEAGRTMSEMLEDWGYFFDTDIVDNIPTGHIQVRRALTLPQPGMPVTTLNQPRFMIHATEAHPMRNLRWGMAHYIHGEFKDDAKSPREVPLDIGKDQADAVRYCHMKDLWFINWLARNESYTRMRMARTKRLLRTRR